MPPLNLVGDFGGGGMLLAFGMACGLLERRSAPAQGQVVDAAMVDGAAVLTTMFHAFRAMGIWEDERGTNMLDTGAHFYDVYETADGKYVSIGSIEPQFYAELLRLTGLEGEDAAAGSRTGRQWPALKERLAAHLQGEDPRRVVRAHGGHRRLLRARCSRSARRPQHPHNVHRGTFVELDGRRAAGARAALLGHPGRGAAAAVARRPAHRRGAGRVGPRRGPDREAPRGRRDRLTLAA